jgi:FMN phosphatase YigB (HAD superfamily)
VNYPFAERLFPDAMEVLARLATFGTTVILSDGDVVFQPRKIERSGLFAAVESRVLVYIHKEQELDEVERRFPADHYVMVDDKVRILTAIKATWGTRVTTVFPRQGRYALDPAIAAYTRPDLSNERIGDLLEWAPPANVAAAQPR